MLQTRFSQMPRIQIYSANAIVIGNVFKYLSKSEVAVHKCSLKKLFCSISDNSQENASRGISFCVDIFFHCFILSIPSYCFKTLFIHSRSTFLFLLHKFQNIITHNKAGFFDGNFFQAGGQFQPLLALRILRRTNLISI